MTSGATFNFVGQINWLFLFGDCRLSEGYQLVVCLSINALTSYIFPGEGLLERPLLDAADHWFGRDLYRATPIYFNVVHVHCFRVSSESSYLVVPRTFPSTYPNRCLMKGWLSSRQGLSEPSCRTVALRKKKFCLQTVLQLVWAETNIFYIFDKSLCISLKICMLSPHYFFFQHLQTMAILCKCYYFVIKYQNTI